MTATAVLLAGLGRFVQDMLLWCTVEFGYLRLGDGFVQGSSIMPQKRNPVALEHARAIGSKALGEATGILLAVHNTPFGDIVDTEDDLQPLVDRMFHDAARALDAGGAPPWPARSSTRRASSAGRARGGSRSPNWPTRWCASHGLAFDTAHAIARRIVEARDEDPAALDRATSCADSVGRACPARRSGTRKNGVAGHPEPAPLRRGPHRRPAARRRR